MSTNNYKSDSRLRRAGALGVAALLFALYATGSSAANFYVDNSSTAASDSNPGTSQKLPWASLKNLSSRNFSPGDVISLKAGTIYGGGIQMTAVGAAAAPIVITAYGSGSKPVVKNSTVYGSYSNAIELDNSQYVIIDGLALTSAAQGGVNLWRSNNNIVRNNDIFGVGIGVNIVGNSNLITGNYMHDLVMVVNKGTSANYGAEGVVIGGLSNEISYNTCIRCIASDNFFGNNGKMIEMYGSVDSSYIHHNYVEDSGNFLEGGVGTARNVRVTYNVSYNNNGLFLCVHYTGAFAYTGPTSFLVANNTVVQTVTPSDTNIALNAIDAPPAVSSIKLINNIMMINQEAAIYSNDVSRENNIYYMQESSSHILENRKNTLGAGEIIANPQFLNGFHLSANSPARGQALTSSEVGSVDFASVPLPANGRDIGAYQFVK